MYRYSLSIFFLCISFLSYAGFPIVDTDSFIEKCDNIILQDGTEISAKVLEITPDLVKYKKCTNLEGPIVSIYKSKILMIRYIDGSKDIFKANEFVNSTSSIDESEGEYQSGLGGFSILFGLASIAVLAILFAPLGIIFGAIALTKDKDKTAGVIGLILSITSFLLFLVGMTLLASS